MGQRPDGEVARRNQVNIRLDDNERAELDRKSARRRLDASKYFRTLLKEDTSDQS